MTTTTTRAAPGPATAKLDELRQAVAEAERRATELGAARSSGRRALDAAKAELAAYYEAVAAGERDGNRAVERRLRARVDELAATVTFEPVLAHGEVVSHQQVDVRAEAELAGARRRVEAAKRELAEYAGQAFDEIAAERIARSRAVGEQGRLVLLELLGWQAARRVEVEWWRRLCAEAGEVFDVARGPRVDLGLDVEDRLRAGRPIPSLIPAPSHLREEGTDGE